MPFPPNRELSKALYKFLETSRKDLEENWKPRLDRDRRLYLGQHYGEEGVAGTRSAGGLRQVTVNRTGAGVMIQHDGQTYREPTFDVLPDPPPFDPLEQLYGDMGQGWPDELNSGQGMMGPEGPFSLPPSSGDLDGLMPTGMEGYGPGAPPLMPPVGLSGGGPSLLNGLPPMGMPSPIGLGAPAGLSDPNGPLPPGSIDFPQGAGIGDGWMPGGPPGAPGGPPSPTGTLPKPIDMRRLLPLLLSERVTRDFKASGAWQAVESALLSMRIFGLGIVMTLWREGEEQPFSDDEVSDYAARQRDMAGMPGVAGGDVEFPDQPKRGEGAVSIPISPYDFICDPDVDAFTWREAAWMGRIYTQPKEELEKAKVKGAKDLPGVMDPSSAGDKFTLDPADLDRVTNKDYPFVILAEVWFRRVWLAGGYTDEEGTGHPAGFYPLVVTWAVSKPEEPLLATVWPYRLTDDRGRLQFPFDVIVNRPVPGHLKGQSDCEIAEPQQVELNHARSVEATYADNMARQKFIVRKGLGAKAKAALASPIIGDFVEVDGEIDKSILPMPVNALKPEVEATAEHALRDMNAHTGTSEMAQGVAVEGANTATEIANIAQESGGRAAKADKKVEDLCGSVATKQYQLRFQLKQTGDPVVVAIPRALGGDGQARTFLIQEEHLVPSRVTVVSGSTKLRDRQQEIQNVTMAMQALQAQGLMASMQNPNAPYDPEYFGDKMLAAMDLDTGDPALRDTGKYMQQAQHMMQMQANAQAQAQMQAMAEAQGGPGGPSPSLSQGTAPSGGVPMPSDADFGSLADLFQPVGGPHGPPH